MTRLPYYSIRQWAVDQRWVTRILLLVAAILGAGFVSIQSIPVVIICLLIGGSVLLAAISPIAAFAFLAVLSPMRTLIATEAQFQLPLDIGQITLLGVLAAWAVNRIVYNRQLVSKLRTPLTVPLLFFLFLMGLTSFIAVSQSAWLNEWLKWIQILVLVTLVFNLFNDRQWQLLVFIISVAGIANALVGIYQFFGGSGALHLVIGGRFFRAFGTFGQPNPFGGFMGIFIPLAAMVASAYGLQAFKAYRTTGSIFSTAVLYTAFYTFASTIMLIGIVFSWSRGAWLGLGGALGVVVIAIPRKTSHGLLLFLAGLTFFVTLWFMGLIPTSIVERLSTSTQEFFAFEDVRGVDITPENFAVVERLAHWQAALNMTTHNPWFGVGLGNYEAAYPSYQLLNWNEPLGHAHNYYLNILAETGIIGLLGYGKVWIIIIWMTWRARQHPDLLARFVVIGLLGSWAYLSIHSFFDNLYVNNLFLHIGLMLGILAVIYSESRKSIRL
ncbi:MAG: O-antigen ligase family protein [Anaerolineae bacterium]|nr:O-antigen ligase family protein [Anaerolineae bacterium]